MVNYFVVCMTYYINQNQGLDKLGQISIGVFRMIHFADVVHITNHWILAQAMAHAPVPNFDVP